MSGIAERWVGIGEAMQVTGCTNATIYRVALMGVVRSKVVGGRLYYSAQDLRRYATRVRSIKDVRELESA